MVKYGLILLVVAILAAFTLKDKKSPKICPLNNDNIITIGDSLANGYGVSENESFALQIPRSLNKNAIKLGINGETSAGLLSRIQAELAKTPSVAAIVISIGGNDFMRKIDKTQTRKNLDSIITQAKQKTSCVILLGVPSGILGGISGSVDSMYGDLAKQHGVIVEDSTMPKILTNSSLKVDQIHPNAQGHKIIAEQITELIKKHK